MDVVYAAPTRAMQHPRGFAFLVAVGVSALMIGLTVSAAGVLELLSGRNLPPGWTRYQPPWTVPAVVVGLALILVGIVTLAATVAVRRRQRRPNTH